MVGDRSSEGEDEAREGVCRAVGASALPDAPALIGGGGGGELEAGDGEVGVEVLAELGDHPVVGAHGPGVHPVAGAAAAALGDDGGGPQGVDGARREAEAAAAAGEHAHHVLLLGRAVEPPLEVRGQEGLHGGVVAPVERLVQPEHQELVALLLALAACWLCSLAVAAAGGGERSRSRSRRRLLLLLLQLITVVSCRRRQLLES